MRISIFFSEMACLERKLLKTLPCVLYVMYVYYVMYVILRYVHSSSDIRAPPEVKPRFSAPSSLYEPLDRRGSTIALTNILGPITSSNGFPDGWSALHQLLVVSQPPPLPPLPPKNR